jgi:F-type H+-transporting ATPase subunit epsilon
MLHFKIATPERVMLDTEANSLTLPTQLGEITILPGHVPLVANLAAGEIRYRQGEMEEFFAVSGGVVEVRPGNEVVVLAESAEFGQEIDEQRAEQARISAQKLMSEQAHSEENFASAAGALERSLARLKIARKHKTRTHKNLESGMLGQ